jgi:hypothetical protein
MRATSAEDSAANTFKAVAVELLEILRKSSLAGVSRLDHTHNDFSEGTLLQSSQRVRERGEFKL